MTTSTPIVLDGSFGEGGGQILRSSLALSAVTGQPFVLDKIRAGRKKPGLMRQHLTCVQAAAALCGAEVHGAALSSTTLRFFPKAIVGGEHRFAIGSAGSVSLVLQTVLPIAMNADVDSVIVVEGGTHVPFAPVVDFLQQVFLPRLIELGANVTLRRDRVGFYPAGGGAVTLTVKPSSSSRAPLEIPARGRLQRVIAAAVCGEADVAGVDQALHVAKRLAKDAIANGGAGDEDAAVVANAKTVVDVVRSPGPGKCLWFQLDWEGGRELLSVIPERGEGPKELGKRLADDVAAFVNAGVAVFEHLADQLVLPMALGAGGRFVTTTPTPHTTTNAAVIERFLPDRVVAFTETPSGTEVSVTKKRL
jgi:RNA 3'-terminal phosphate cyclase (ATP)